MNIRERSSSWQRTPGAGGGIITGGTGLVGFVHGDGT